MDIPRTLINSYCAFVVDSERHFADALRRDTEATLARFDHLRSGQDLLLARGNLNDRSAAGLLATLGHDFSASLRDDYLWCTGQPMRHNASTNDIQSFITHTVIERHTSTGTARRLFTDTAANWVELTWRRYHDGTLATLHLPDPISLAGAPSHLDSVGVARQYNTVRAASRVKTSEELDEDVAAEREAEEQRRKQDEFDWTFPDGRSYPEDYDPTITATVSGADNRMLTQSLAEERRLVRIRKHLEGGSDT